MQQAFGTVVWVVSGVGLLAALAGLFFSGKAWEEYGRHHLVRDSDRPQTGGAGVGSEAALLERDLEIRQLLAARNARRARCGEAPVDVETEIEREIAGLSGI